MFRFRYVGRFRYAEKKTKVSGKEVQTIYSNFQGISVHKLSKKINEFNAENEMLKCSLDQVKAEFVKELEEIVNFLRCLTYIFLFCEQRR